ncbi:MAG TPA: Uma2 family endonuclease [Terriglobia bacterium]|nr:Uma2 family endonuclease [Terriglobia bacterium]
MATKTLLTIEEFLRVPESDDARYELVEGELVKMSPAMLRHNLVRDKVLVLLKEFVGKRNLGTVVAEQPFHLFGNTVRVPDVAFIRHGRKLPMDKLPQGAPDLAVEVVSPTNTPREIDQRISDYFAAGCKRVWVLYPEHQEVYIHGLAGVSRRRGDDFLEDNELLPGLSVKASSLFDFDESVQSAKSADRLKEK